MCPGSLRLPCAVYLSPALSFLTASETSTFFLECSQAWHLAFPAPQSPPCVCARPRALQVPFRAPKRFQCTPKLSFHLLFYPRALPESSRNPETSMSVSEGPEPSQVPLAAPRGSPQAFLKALACAYGHPRILLLTFRAPCSPPCAFPCVPHPSVHLLERFASGSASPPMGTSRETGEQGSWVGFPSQRAHREKSCHRVSARPTGEEGSPPSACMQGQERKRRFGDLSFVHNPDEKDSCKAEGREWRGEERRRRCCVTTNLAWEGASSYSGGVEAQEAGARVSSHIPGRSKPGRLPPCGKRQRVVPS